MASHARVRHPAPKATVETAPREWWRHVAAVAAEFGISARELRRRAGVNGPETPTEWVEAAMHVSCTCPKCKGRGIVGSPIQAGKCFACKGTGTQGHRDRKRNLDYWDLREAQDERIAAIEAR